MNRAKKEKNRLFLKLRELGINKTSDDLDIYIYNNNHSKYITATKLRSDNLMESDKIRI